MSIKCEAKVAAICKEYSVGYSHRPLKLGYERLEIHCDNYAVLSELRDEIKAIRGAYVESTAHFDGEFSGALYIMDKDSNAKLMATVKEEQERVEDWWQRYHVADEYTRRLMACGAIS